MADNLAEPVPKFREKREPVAPEVRLAAAKLYGQGFRRPQVAAALQEYLVHAETAPEHRLQRARAKLRGLEQTQEFRDLIYQHAVVALDLDTPRMLGGLARQGRKGRVDAIKLALDITGRRKERVGDGGMTAVQVNVAFGAAVPRPSVIEGRARQLPSKDIDG